MKRNPAATYQAGHVSLNADHVASLTKEAFLASNIRTVFAMEYEEGKIDAVMSAAYDGCKAAVAEADAEEKLQAEQDAANGVTATAAPADEKPAPAAKPVPPFMSSSPALTPAKPAEKPDEKATS